MLTRRARQLVQQAHPSDDLAFVVSIQEKPKDSAIEAQPDRGARRRFVNEFYARVKAPVIREVKLLEPAGVRIVDPLEGTPQLIIAATARTWRSIFQQPHFMFSAPSVVVSTNEPEVTIP